MLGFLYRIIVGRFSQCKHKWKIIDRGGLFMDNRAVGKRYTLQCEHCGDLKHHEFW